MTGLVLIIGLALVFDYINGFHDAANSVATIVSTPGGLVGAIVWDLLTWWWGLPTSSSHALLGGLAGAALVKAGPGALDLTFFGKIDGPGSPERLSTQIGVAQEALGSLLTLDVAALNTEIVTRVEAIRAGLPSMESCE